MLGSDDIYSFVNYLSRDSILLLSSSPEIQMKGSHHEQEIL